MSITSNASGKSLGVSTVVDAIGNTPLIDLGRLAGEKHARIFGKAEFMNPGGSVKDRICRSMLVRAREKGLLKSDSVVIESTSGNTGLGLAMICASWGIECVLTMPASMSIERIKLLKSYGARIELSSKEGGMAEAILLGEQIAKEVGKRAFQPGQFENPDNPLAHIETTGPEIVEQLQNEGLEANAFVAGVGTGGTVSGVGTVLKEAFAGCKVVAVEPDASPVIQGGKPGPHGIQGIGAGFIPDTLNLKILDEVISVSEQDAVRMKKILGANAGVLVGISAGANVAAASKIAEQLGPDDVVVTVLCDTGERYLSLDL